MSGGGRQSKIIGMHSNKREIIHEQSLLAFAIGRHFCYGPRCLSLGAASDDIRGGDDRKSRCD